MIDVHCHLIPGIDDGPDTLHETLAMARAAVADGIREIVVTPHILPGHWNNDRCSIVRKCEQLRLIFAYEGIPLLLHCAAEVRICEFVTILYRKRAIPLYGAHLPQPTILLELPHDGIVPGSINVVHWLRRHGIRALLAHPERNRLIIRHREALDPFIEAGCWLQLTAGALTGRFGKSARRLAEGLLDEGMVQVVASDAHNTTVRPPVLSTAYGVVAARYGDEMAQRLFVSNPEMLLRGPPIAAAAPDPSMT